MDSSFTCSALALVAANGGALCVWQHREGVFLVVSKTGRELRTARRFDEAAEGA